MLIGHHKLFDQMKAHSDAGSLAHAQLFVGPKHIGKTKLALSLAIHLQGADSQPVLKKQILEGAHADTLLLLDDGENLSIKEVRRVIERCTISHTSPYLIVVIENIGRMKPEAMNALLKTIEEPPEGVIFFLTANRDEDILPTIRSRCHVTYMTTVNDDELSKACDGHAYTKLLVMFAMGRPGKLRRLIEDEDYFKAHQELNDQLNLFLESPDIHRALSLSRDYEKNETLQEMLDILLHRVRSMALTNSVPPVLAHLDLTETMDTIESTKGDIDRNINKKLLLDNLFLPFVP